MNITPYEEQFTESEKELIKILDKDLKKAAKEISEDEARFLVDAYYQLQHHRITAQNQIRSIDKGQDEAMHGVLDWLFKQNSVLENQIKLSLDIYSMNSKVGTWMRSIKGIGPVIAAGFLAHIDIEKAFYAGCVWSYAGLNPTVEWEKGKKRPWNADLKTLCWKLGESFVKVCNNPDDYYGKLYLKRKELEIQKNEAGLFAETAAEILTKKTYKKETIAYKHYSIGKLPPAHIYARAKRFAVKIFLAHLHEVMFEDHYKKQCPGPYAFEVLSGHTNRLYPPLYNSPWK